MTRQGKITAVWFAAILAAAGLAGSAQAASPAQSEAWLAALEVEATRAVAAEAPAEQGWQKPGVLKALSFSIDYTLASDYIWRGLNFSEFAGEGREKLNHQLGVGFEVDLAELGAPGIGRIGGSFWFEWYGGQESLTGWSGNNLQEVDYLVYWAYDIEPIGLGVEVGWVAYHFPRLRDEGSTTSADFAYTHEAYITLSFDDSKIFGKPILNPTVSYYMDLDDVRASAIVFGVSHDFVLSECLEDTPILKDITVTPSLSLMVDHRYYDKLLGSKSKGTRLGCLEYGLAISYDLSSALAIPEQYGALSLSGFVNYSQSLHDDDATVQDEFYGGCSVGWEW